MKMSGHSQHVLVLPFPAQGHVKPLMLFSQKLAEHGFKVTFVNTDFNHKRVLSANMDVIDQSTTVRVGSQIDLVSIPDGLGPDDDRADLGQLAKAMLDTMPQKLEQLIRNLNATKSNVVTCVVADGNMGWAMEVAAQLEIKRAIIWPAAAAVFLLINSIPRLINDGILGPDGLPTKRQMIQLSTGMLSMDSANIPWSIGDASSKKVLSNYVMRYIQGFKLTDWWLCNTFYDIESIVFSSLPKLIPVGPIMVNQTNSLGDSSGAQFWAEDNSCLSWLDQQKPCSVIYIAFGSFTIHNQAQFEELARGLELIGRPFLWVVRPGFIVELGQNGEFDMDQFQGKHSRNLRKIVNWAPQQKVLSHPSIACFVSHCGWNSTLEGLSNGVPFLCWPYFADQFYNKSYICDIWKVGMGFEPNKNGIISSEEVKNKVDQLLSNGDIRRRALELKEMAMKNISEDGQSSKNFYSFIKWLST